MLYTLLLRESRARVPSKLSSTGRYLKTLALGDAGSTGSYKFREVKFLPQRQTFRK